MSTHKSLKKIINLCFRCPSCIRALAKHLSEPVKLNPTLESKCTYRNGIATTYVPTSCQNIEGLSFPTEDANYKLLSNPSLTMTNF